MNNLLSPLNTEAFQIGALFVRAKGSMIDGLRYYVECGKRLKVVRESLPHGQWKLWLQENQEDLGFRKSAAYLLMGAAEFQLAGTLNEAAILVFIRKLWGHATGTQGHVSIDRNWYTPEIYIEMAREVMGGIDLDPASDAEAQKIVKANLFYNKEDDGLKYPWHSRVWLNPPWSDPQRWLKKLIAEKVDQAIVLTTNATETEWFQDFVPQVDVVCFPRGRIKCYGHDNGSGPLRGQAFFYIGKNRGSFQEIFRQGGLEWVRMVLLA